jgi:hypothetical protein
MSGIWKNKRRWWPKAAMILLGLSIVLSQLYKTQLVSLVADEPVSTQITPPPCNLNHSACPLPIITPVASEAPWTFSITPQPIPVSAPLSFALTPPERVLVTNIPEAVWVDLTGDSMDMGLIRVRLEQQPNGQWVGTGSIPVCVTGAMRWRARIHIALSQTNLQADWVFTAPESDARH